MGLISHIRRWWNGLFNKNNLKEAFGIEHLAISDEMLRLQQLYRDIVRGRAPWNLPPPGSAEGVPSLMLAGSISAEVAQNVVVGLESEVTGGEREITDGDRLRTETITTPRSEYLNAQYAKVKEKLRAAVIAACNGGEVIFKPHMTDGSLEVTVVETDSYWPLEYNGQGELTSVAFGASVERDKYVYKLLERHTYNKAAQTHAIEYKAYRSERTAQGFSSSGIGQEVAVNSVPEWEALRDITITGIEQPLFVHLRIPSADVVESPQRQGLPIWSKAIEMLRKADLQESRTDWEFEGGELAIDAPEDWFKKDARGNPVLPKGKERLFRTFDNNQKEGSASPYNPEFRIAGLDMRMNQILRRIEFLCGLSYGVLSDNNTQDKTAEEFRASKRRFFTTVSDIQEALGKAMEHLVTSFSVLADLQGIAQSDYEFTWVPSDAIMADREREFDERLRAQNAGWLSAQENRAWWFGVDVDSDEARNLPEQFEEEF